MTILYFLIALGVLISIHEFGHFIVAKKSGVKVEEFSLGFGPRLFGWRRGDTDYRISLLPFGGYVKMLGEQPGEEGADDPRAFTRKPIWKRALIVAFGPLMNLFLCLALFPLVFLLGRDLPKFFNEPPVVEHVWKGSPAAEVGLEPHDRIAAINQKEIATWEEFLNEALAVPAGGKIQLSVIRAETTFNAELERRALLPGEKAYLGIEPTLFLGNEPIIGKVDVGSRGAEAGLQPGDRVLAVGGVKVSWWTELAEKIQESHGTAVALTILRGDDQKKFSITPAFDEASERWRLGIQKEASDIPLISKQYGLLEAIKEGSKEFYKLLVLTLGILKKLFSFQLSYKVLGGPLMIAKTTAAAAESGLADFLYFLGFMSLQLAILNLLPIPVLDGGHLFFLGLEGIRRKPLNPKIQLVAQQIGFGLLLLLLITVTMNDLNAIWGVENFLKKFPLLR